MSCKIYLLLEKYMNYQKNIFQIKSLEEKFEWLLVDFKKLSLLETKNNNYREEDKQEFLLLWKEFVLLFLKIEKLIHKNNYRKYFILKIIQDWYYKGIYWDFISMHYKNY